MEPINTPNPTPQNTPAPNPNPAPADPTPKTDPVPAPKDDGKKEPTVQELMVQIATLKRAVDKASSEAADYKKKYNSKLTEQEVADQQKAEEQAAHEAEFKELQRKVKINEYAAQFTKLGYGDLAEKAATAQVDGDTDELFRIQQDVQAKLLKNAQDAWIKTRPQVQTGSQDTAAEDPFLKGFLGK